MIFKFSDNFIKWMFEKHAIDNQKVLVMHYRTVKKYLDEYSQVILEDIWNSSKKAARKGYVKIKKTK